MLDQSNKPKEMKMKTILGLIVSGLLVMFFWSCSSDSSPAGPSEPEKPKASCAYKESIDFPST